MSRKGLKPSWADCQPSLSQSHFIILITSEYELITHVVTPSLVIPQGHYSPLLLRLREFTLHFRLKDVVPAYSKHG